MINMFEPNVEQKSHDLLSEVFKSKWIGRGKLAAEFEEKLSALLCVERNNIHTIASCSDAIFGSFEILGIIPKSEVIVPTNSFPAVINAIIAAGLTPKIIDIELSSGNLDINCLADACNSNTSAVFVTHYGGIPANINKIRQIVGNNTLIIEDAACALGTRVNGVACGTQGDFGCWSFDAMKLLTCGEGGAIYVADTKRLNYAKEYFYLGLPSTTTSGINSFKSSDKWWEYQLSCPGRRSMFTDINAAIGLPQFETIRGSLNRRTRIRSHYCDVLNKLNVNYLRQDDSNCEYSNYFFTIITPKRDELAAWLKQHHIYSTLRYYPLHKINIFSKYAQNCTNSEKFNKQSLNIPIHNHLTDDDVIYIGNTICSFFTKNVTQIC